MPYCPDCGVEVESEVRKCPLCQLEMPIRNKALSTKEAEARFPEPLNIRAKQIRQIKNQIFFTITLIILSALFCLGFLHTFLNIQNHSILYGMICVTGTWLYSIFLLGYFANRIFSILGTAFVTALIAIGIDFVDGGVTWSLHIALPIIFATLLIIILGINIYRRFKHKNQYIVIPVYICTGVALLCPTVETITDMAFTGSVRLSWSVVTLIPLLTIASVILGLYLKLPEKIRNKVRKKLHI